MISLKIFLAPDIRRWNQRVEAKSHITEHARSFTGADDELNADEQWKLQTCS